MRTCTYCLSEVPDIATKCKYCGEWLHNNDGEVNDILKTLSSTNPTIRSAEKNVENVRFVWKFCLGVCIVAAAALFPLRTEELVDWRAVLPCVAFILLGLVTGAFLSSVSHILELLMVVVRNQVHRENHLTYKVQKMQQALHE
jgi:hypothetical protein